MQAARHGPNAAYLRASDILIFVNPFATVGDMIYKRLFR